jgi:hypothetical protein
MKKKFSVCCIILLITLQSCDTVITDKEQVSKLVEGVCEEAYFQGQKDAINGDIRIKLNKDSCYIWVKSCWNSGKKPSWNPTYLDSKKITFF